MSRSGYMDAGDYDDTLAYGRWRGMVKSAINGRRGQKLLAEIAKAMDAMPVKELVAGELEIEGQYCTLGVVGRARGIDMSEIDPEDYEKVASTFDIAECLAQEIVFMNDEAFPDGEYVWTVLCGPLQSQFEHHRRQVFVKHENMNAARWKYMREWIEGKLKADALIKALEVGGDR